MLMNGVNKMAYFPFFTDITDKKAVIAGGGQTALRKAEILLSFGADVTVISPEFVTGFDSLIKNNKNLTLIKRKFDISDIDGTFMVVAATNDNTLNEQISKKCFELKIPVNVVDNTPLCSFIFPSIVKQQDIVCGISSGGKSPVITQYIKEEIIKFMPYFLGDINNRMGEIREAVKQKINSQKLRGKTMRRIFETLLKSRNLSSDKEINEIINSMGDKNDIN